MYELYFSFQIEKSLLRILVHRPDIRLYLIMILAVCKTRGNCAILLKSLILSNWLSAGRLHVSTHTRKSVSSRTSSFTKQSSAVVMLFTWHLSLISFWLWTQSRCLLSSPGGYAEGSTTSSWSLAAEIQVQFQTSSVGVDVSGSNVSS